MFSRFHRRRGDEGFTLIELLIVVIILAILAAIIIFAVGNFRKDSVVNACKTDFRSVQTAEEAYKSKEGKYVSDGPSTWTNLSPTYLTEGPGAGPDYNLTAVASGTGDGTLTISVRSKTTTGGTALGSTTAACSLLT